MLVFHLHSPRDLQSDESSASDAIDISSAIYLLEKMVIARGHFRGQHATIAFWL
jgi:hypothetical protein